MAEPITQARLRALAAVHPEQGRVLSVFLNLDPAQFATPNARSSAITSVITAAAHKVEESDGLSHDERMALRDDVERVREVLIGSDIAANGTRAVAVYACGPEDLLEVVRLRRPVDNRVVLDRTAFVEPLVMQGTDERWMVLLTNRRAARLFFGPGDSLEETDRIVDDVHSQHDQGGWSQLNYQRSVEKEVSDHLAHTAELAFDLYKKRGADRVLIGVPAELITEFKGKLHPYLAERIAGKIAVDVENASLDDVCAAAGEAITAHTMRDRARGARPAGRGRRPRRPRRGGNRRGARRAQPGARGDAADLGELPRRRAHGLPGRAAAARGGQHRRAGRRHRRAGDREGDRAVRERHGGTPPRRPRPAGRDRGFAAVLSRALVIVDFQNDFTPGGALAVPDGDAIAEQDQRARRLG